MHIKIERDLFNQAIQNVGKAVSNKTTMPVLTGIKIVTNQEGLVLTGSNSDITIQNLIPLIEQEPQENDDQTKEKEQKIEILEEGGIVLPAKFLADMIRKMPNQQVDITVEANFRAKLTAGNSEMYLNGLDPEEYPSVTQIDNGQQFALPGDLLETMIHETVFAVSQSESRPILTGVHWSLKEDHLTMMSTDSHRLAKREAMVETSVDTYFEQVVVPGKSLGELSRLFGDQGMVEMILGKNQLMAKAGKIIFTTRLLEGVYPDTNRIIPQNFQTEIVVSTREMLAAIDRASLLARESEYNVVKCSIKADEPIVITSHSPEIGQVTEQVSLQNYTGEECKISFNSRYMIEALRAIEESEVRISLTGPMSPFILRHREGEHILQLILPVRTA